MTTIKSFKHGEEGTHSVCNKHNIGGKSVCCECSGKTDCSNMTHETQKQLSECRKCGRKSEVVMLGQQCPFCHKEVNALEKEIEELREFYVEMHPMHGHDSHNSPLLYHSDIEKVDELFEDIRQSLVRFAKSVIEQAMPEEKTEKTILVSDRQWDDGFNDCRTQFQENVEKILNQK